MLQGSKLGRKQLHLLNDPDLPLSVRVAQFLTGDDNMVITNLKCNWRRRWIENLNLKKQGESLKCEPVPDCFGGSY